MPAKRTKEQNAAYMREYRAKKAAAALEANRQADLAMVGDPRDRKIAELEAEIERLRTTYASTSVLGTGTVHIENPVPTVEQWKAAGGPTVMHEGREMIVPASLPRPTTITVGNPDTGATRTYQAKPPFLAAPDEDCVCGHDRHSYHLTGPCTAYIRPKTKCSCTGFMADLGFE